MSTTPHVRYAAGILPCTYHEGLLLFLVGKDVRDGTFSDFGGKCERYDRGDPVTTACREFFEETYGTILDTKQIRARMTPKTTALLRGVTQNSHQYFMYLVQVPYIPHLRKTVSKLIGFLKCKNLQRMYVEKTDVMWVTYAQLKTMPKRAVFAKTIEAHQGLLERLAGSEASAFRRTCDAHAPEFETVL